MRQIKFRGRTMGGDYVEGLPTYKRLQNGKVVPALMTKRSGLQRDVIPVTVNSIEQYIGTHAGAEMWELVDLEDD